jgi:hypothetical protein
VKNLEPQKAKTKLAVNALILESKVVEVLKIGKNGMVTHSHTIITALDH